MSTMEKVIGIVVVIIVCFVFLILILMVSMYLGRWRAKGINPSNSFPRNPKGGGLTREQQRALNVGAILGGWNSDFIDSLQTSKPMARKTIKTLLSKGWEINSTKDALETLEDLKYGRHRQEFNFVLKNASKFLTTDKHFSLNPRDVYDQAGLSLLDKRLLNDYKDQVALVEKNIDLLLNEIIKASSYEDVEKYKPLFGDDETFSICIQIIHRFYEQCLLCTNSITNLKETLSILRKWEFVGMNPTELDSIDATAWDMGRMVNVARYCYDLGYITESQAWEYIFFAEQESAARYTDWADFGKAYVIGRALWGGSNTNLSSAMSTVNQLKKDKKSPWALVPLREE